MSKPEKSNEAPRRGFLYQASAAVVALTAGLAPIGVGIAAFFAPLSGRKAAAARFLKVTTLDSLPADGKPYRFTVIDDRRDAWTYYPPEPVGSIFLIRDGDDATPVAFQTVCPHLGCMVDWKSEASEFLCPCHDAHFTVDGARTDPAKSPSPRDLDTLAVEVRGQEIWVDYRTFKGGTSEKVDV